MDRHQEPSYDYRYNPADKYWEGFEEFLVDHFRTCELNIDNTIVVKQSRIDGAGRGVFAKRNIEAFEIIQRYYGEEAPVDENRSKQEELYTFDTQLGYKIYPADSCLVKYINDTVKLDHRNKKIGRLPLLHNTQFECWEGYVFVYAIDDIKQDDELYIDYGDYYWN